METEEKSAVLGFKSQRRPCLFPLSCDPVLPSFGPVKTLDLINKSLCISIIQIIQHYPSILLTFLGETEHFSGKNGELRWSILVGRQKHNVQKQ